MPYLKSIVGLALVGLLIVPTGHAQEGEDCPYPKVSPSNRGRIIEDLEAKLEAHMEWRTAKREAHMEWQMAKREGSGTANPEIPGRANFCGADLSFANLKGADLGEANLKGVRLNGANLEGADLISANLEGALLFDAHLKGALLFDAHLEGANLIRAHLEGANLFGANLEGADVLSANLEGARLDGANLEGADLSWASLKGATLDRTVLADAKLSNADLSGALYQPATAPAQGYLSGISGLRSIRFCPGKGSGLVQLRTALKEAGLRDLERKATYTLERGRTRHALARWNPAEHMAILCLSPEGDLPKRDRTAAIEGALRLVFFEWTTDYGLSYGRPILILLGLVGVFTLVYLPALVIAPKRPEHSSGIYRIWPEGRIKRSGWEPSGWGVKVADDVTVDRLNARGIAALGQAFYFSVVSAFHIGWRDLNVGSWIARMQPREYALRAKGWVRVVSGVQSLISVYLIAMWVLTYFGKPFE